MRMIILTYFAVLSLWFMTAFVGLSAAAQAIGKLPLGTSLPPSMFERAVLETQAGNFGAALRSYRDAIQTQDHPALAYANCCLVEIHLKQYQTAIDDCTQALQLRSENWEARLNRGLAQYRVGNFELALLDNTALLAAQPNDWRAYNNRGLTLAALHQDELAIADYDMALRHTPPTEPLTVAEIQLNRGRSLVASGKTAAAFLAFDQAILLAPLDDRSYFSRGCLHNQQQHYQQAIQDFDQALSLRPNHPQVQIDRAIAYYNLGQTQKALKDLRIVAQVFFHQGNQVTYDQVQTLIDQMQHSMSFELQVG